MENILYDRDIFRQKCLERDKYSCVICNSKENLSVHHIMERRLFSDGGYYLNNGASLCQNHHLEAEMTILDPETLREAAKINQIILPEHLYSEAEYDKWGNEILKSGERLQGELFWDTSVQKILSKGNVLGDFTNRVKYPRTFHLPWSPGMNRDDRQMTDVGIFEGQRVMICEKLDGENCLDENSIIITEKDGPKTIKWICEERYKGKVLTYNIEMGEKEYQKIINWQILENNDDWYEVEIDNGTILLLTGNHYIYLPNLDCYRKVKDLSENDEVYVKN